MITFGRDASGLWREVDTDANGFDDDCYLTTVAQVLQSQLGESPFFAQYGLPARQSVTSRTHPDYFINRVREQFANMFTSLSIVKTVDLTNNEPTYYIDALKLNGSAASETIMI
jgi:hypothetical protein